MNTFIKKHINLLIGIFILLSPLLDLLTGLCLHTFKLNITIGIIIRVLFLIFICYTVLFIFKKKKLLIPYLVIGIYFILYTLGIIIYKDGVGLFKEVQGLIKVFYFPILFISLYSIKEKIKISKLTLFTTLFFYLIFIFVPLTLNIGYKSYEITKAGTLGFFNSANEISGIISILTPIMFIVIASSKNIIPKIALSIMYLVVILMIGTKTPLLTLCLTIGFTLAYLWFKLLKEKKYKSIIISLLVVIIGVIGLSIIIPRTNFYKNIETHLHYLKLNSITEVFQDKKLIDHFIFSSRLSFLQKKAKLYNTSSLYQKIFGIGYLKKGKTYKLIEMDYFDILYSHGIVGFLIFFTITIYVLIKTLHKDKKITYGKYMLYISFLFIISLSFFTGHIITAPAVSILSIIIILSLQKREKKDLLFASKFMEIGGIENALVNLLNNIDYRKYNVDLILEERRGELLSKVNKNVNITELKVSNNKSVFLRKLINVTRKLVFKIFNYQNYDFSCCYTTYSYSSNKIAKIASNNNAFYVHSDYKYVYQNKEEYLNFFNTRKVYEYKRIIFVSNESKKSFLNYYKNLEGKTEVLNNLINTKSILEKSKEDINLSKRKDKKLLVFVGRLDDSSKKLKRAINLVKEIKELELWIVGDGPDRTMYEEYVKENKIIDRVIFVGKKLNPYPYMKKANYIILTSDYEGFPVTYLEAITLNKDIITTLPTSDDSIDIKNYAHIVSKDEKEMVKEVKGILKLKEKNNTINLDEIQKNRMKRFEEIFNN